MKQRNINTQEIYQMDTQGCGSDQGRCKKERRIRLHQGVCPVTVRYRFDCRRVGIFRPVEACLRGRCEDVITCENSVVKGESRDEARRDQRGPVASFCCPI